MSRLVDTNVVGEKLSDEIWERPPDTAHLMILRESLNVPDTHSKSTAEGNLKPRPHTRTWHHHHNGDEWEDSGVYLARD